jgi:shikimate kinase
MTRHLFLTGFMGSGKTYWGSRVADRLQIPFVDLDAWIEAQENRSINAIFSTLGENGFRVLESGYLHRLAALPPSVVATGGGTPCFFDNLNWMKRHGHIVYLEVPEDHLLERLLPEREQRPLIRNLDEAGLREFIREQMTWRKEYYRQSDETLAYTTDEAFILKQLSKLAASLPDLQT